ncbi:helix-turn-helix transcriptional regulator [Paenibacillus sp. FSL L8-0158]|uniref:helix-turn-helix domain-containing protein n=1 Tax=Paenibacillus sp. FSL L8-0158 TaxID=2954752 RepID=UPI003158AB46
MTAIFLFTLHARNLAQLKEANVMIIDFTTVKKLRLVYRLSLAEMAALLGVSESHLWRVEKGERPINETMRRRCVEELELTPDKLTRLLDIYRDTLLPGK